MQFSDTRRSLEKDESNQGISTPPNSLGNSPFLFKCLCKKVFKRGSKENYNRSEYEVIATVQLGVAIPGKNEDLPLEASKRLG